MLRIVKADSFILAAAVTDLYGALYLERVARAAIYDDGPVIAVLDFFAVFHDSTELAILPDKRPRIRICGFLVFSFHKYPFPLCVCVCAYCLCRFQAANRISCRSSCSVGWINRVGVALIGLMVCA